MIKDYEFKNNCDLKTLIESYGLEYPKRRDMSLKIGPDGVIYILVHTKTNERGYITLSLIVLDVDWDEEKITRRDPSALETAYKISMSAQTTR